MSAGRKTAALVAVAAAGLALATTLGSAAATAGPSDAVWHVVVLGDSGASGSGDPTGLGWGGRYARLLRQRLHHKVTFTNLASDGLGAFLLLDELRSDPKLRATVANADIILFGSTAGSALNTADENLSAGNCKGTACYAAQLRPWATQFNRIVATAKGFRGSKQTVLLGVTDPNVVPGAQGVVPHFATVSLGLFQARTIDKTVCAVLRSHGGNCIDVLTPFNGRSGTEDAYKKGLMNKIDCCYASGKGQQMIAELLYRAGLNRVKALP